MSVWVLFLVGKSNAAFLIGKPDAAFLVGIVANLPLLFYVKLFYVKLFHVEF
ncbi:hypothetical protein FHX51_000125 [Aeriscardovia aeriphila]|nr:hypothetical protein [Aeriscardovia aeriphila]